MLIIKFKIIINMYELSQLLMSCHFLKKAQQIYLLITGLQYWRRKITGFSHFTSVTNPFQKRYTAKRFKLVRKTFQSISNPLTNQICVIYR